jgi:hypothetical protein
MKRHDLCNLKSLVQLPKIENKNYGRIEISEWD